MKIELGKRKEKENINGKKEKIIQRYRAIIIITMPKLSAMMLNILIGGGGGKYK